MDDEFEPDFEEEEEVIGFVNSFLYDNNELNNDEKNDERIDERSDDANDDNSNSNDVSERQNNQMNEESSGGQSSDDNHDNDDYDYINEERNQSDVNDTNDSSNDKNINEEIDFNKDNNNNDENVVSESGINDCAQSNSKRIENDFVSSLANDNVFDNLENLLKYADGEELSFDTTSNDNDDNSVGAPTQQINVNVSELMPTNNQKSKVNVAEEITQKVQKSTNAANLKPPIIQKSISNTEPVLHSKNSKTKVKLSNVMTQKEPKSNTTSIMLSKKQETKKTNVKVSDIAALKKQKSSVNSAELLSSNIVKSIVKPAALIPPEKQISNIKVSDVMMSNNQKNKVNVSESMPSNIQKNKASVSESMQVNIRKNKVNVTESIPSNIQKNKVNVSESMPSNIQKNKVNVSELMPSNIQKNKVMPLNHQNDNVAAILKEFVAEKLPQNIQKSANTAAGLMAPKNHTTSLINNNNTLPTAVAHPSTAQNVAKPNKTVDLDKIYFSNIKKYLLTKTLPTVYCYSSNKEDFIKEAKKFKLENGKFYFHNKLVVEDDAKQQQIARDAHLVKNNPKKHKSKNQSVKQIEQKYFWGGIRLDVENVYDQCLVCNPIKAQLCQLWKFVEVGIVSENVIIVRDLNKKSQILNCVVLEIITPQSFTEHIVPLFVKYGIPDAIRVVKSLIFDTAFVELFINILREELSEVLNQMKSIANLVDDNEFFPKLPTMDVISEVRNNKCPATEEDLNHFTFTDSTKTPLYVFYSSEWAVNQSVLETIDKLITDVKSKYKDWKLKLPAISSLFQMCGINFKCNESIKIEPNEPIQPKKVKKELDRLKISFKATNAKDSRDSMKKPIIIDSSGSNSDSDSESNCSIKDKMTLENDLYLSSSSSDSSLSDEDDVDDNNNEDNDNDKSELNITLKSNNVEMKSSMPSVELSAIQKPFSPLKDSVQQEFQQISQKEISPQVDKISHSEEQLKSIQINSDSSNDSITLINDKLAEPERLDNTDRECLIEKYDKNNDCKKCVVVLIKYPRKFFSDAIDGKLTDFDKILSEQKQLTKATEYNSLKRKPSIDTLSECDINSSKKLKSSNENENSSKIIIGSHCEPLDVENAQSSATSDRVDDTSLSSSSRKRNLSSKSNESIESKSSSKSSSENRKRLKSIHMKFNIKNKAYNKPDSCKPESNLSGNPKSQKQTIYLNLQAKTKDNISNNETNKDKDNTSKYRDNSNSSNKLRTTRIEMASFNDNDLSEATCSDDSDEDDVSPIKLNLNKANAIETQQTPRIFKCDQCQFQSNDAHLLLGHKAKHRMQMCSECSMTFNSSNDLEEHKKAEHPPNTAESLLYGCDKCKFTCYYIDDIDSHLKNTHIETIGENNDKFKCSLCKKVFSEKTLPNHLLIHRKYKCAFCDFFASKFIELERHGRQKHMDYEKYFFRCVYCPDFVSPCFGSVTDHKKICHAIQYTESGEKCCVCDITINSFKADIVLEHLITHVNDEIYIYKCRFDSTRCNRMEQMQSHCYKYHGTTEIEAFCEPFDKTHLFHEITKKLKNRNANAIRKIPNQNETQNAIAALMDDSFQDNYDNEDEENIIYNDDALGNALNIAFGEGNDNDKEVPVLSIPNSSPEQFVEFYVTEDGLELIDKSAEDQD